jgi:2-polyprenyl-3-methyl-5-hydroxy-6-metoxy-1,4-benzoquinol methylase
MTRTGPRAGYQPLWEDGREIGTGWRDASGRYEAIKRYLVGRQRRIDVEQFPTGPTVLEIGAYNGYFCRRLADDFGACCLAVDGQPFLTEYRSKGPLNGYVDVRHELWHHPHINAAPSFDIGICLSVLHHHGDWDLILGAMLDRCTVLFVELAHPDEKLANDAKTYAFAAMRAVKQLGADTLAETPPMNLTKPLRPLMVIDQGQSAKEITP